MQARILDIFTWDTHDMQAPCMHGRHNKACNHPTSSSLQTFQKKVASSGLTWQDHLQLSGKIRKPATNTFPVISQEVGKETIFEESFWHAAWTANRSCCHALDLQNGLMPKVVNSMKQLQMKLNSQGVRWDHQFSACCGMPNPFAIFYILPHWSSGFQAWNRLCVLASSIACSPRMGWLDQSTAVLVPGRSTAWKRTPAICRRSISEDSWWSKLGGNSSPDLARHRCFIMLARLVKNRHLWR